MVKISRYLVIMIFVEILLSSCNDARFDISQKSNLLEDPSNLFDKIELIQLETTDSSLIGNINKIELLDSSVYILDGTQRCILVFDNYGNFKKKLSKIGKGPGEYVNIGDFNVEEDGTIEVLSNYKIIFYDRNFNVINEINLPDVAHFFYKLDKMNYALYHLQARKRLSIYNSISSKTIYTGIESPKYSKLMPVNPFYSPFYSSGKEVFFKSSFTNDIYKVTPDGLEKNYTFYSDFPIDLSDLPTDKERKFYIKSYFNLTSPYVLIGFIGKNYIQAYSRVGNDRFYDVTNIRNNKSVYFKELADSAKYFGYFNTEKFTYGFMDASDAIIYQKDLKLKKMIQKKSNFSISSDDKSLNPVLVKYYFKK